MSHIIAPIITLFNYEFMRNAFVAGTIAAIVAGIVGYFVVIRGLAFAGHALGHVGFAGAAGAGLVGLSPFTGQLLLSVLAASGMGLLGKRVHKSDMVIGIVLAFVLGLGMLFLRLYSTYAGQATVILFGDLLGVSNELVWSMSIYSAVSLFALAVIARPLLFSSLEPELAEAKGVSLSWISVLFLSIVAIAVTQASQVVGVLLVFTLLVGPAAAVLHLVKSVWKGIIATVLLAIAVVWIGIFLAYVTDWPTTFWISTVSLIAYLLSAGVGWLRV